MSQHGKPTRTIEGHEYRIGRVVINGLPCRGVISPATNIPQLAPRTFDAIIIGAGFAGLTAARDLTTAGKLSVPLYKFRDYVLLNEPILTPFS